MKIREDLRMTVGPVEIPITDVTDQHITGRAAQSVSGPARLWHGDDVMWEEVHVELGYGSTLSLPRILLLEAEFGKTFEIDMATEDGIAPPRAQESSTPPPPPPVSVREAIEAVKGEARFRIRTVVEFAGSVPNNEARTIINRAAASVQREHAAYGLDEWPKGLHWRDAAREVAEGWISPTD